MSNQIVVSANHLKHIHEQMVLLSIDTGHLAMALQAAQVDCAISGGVINAVIMALSSSTATSEDLSDQLDGILSASQEATDYE